VEVSKSWLKDVGLSSLNVVASQSMFINNLMGDMAFINQEIGIENPIHLLEYLIIFLKRLSSIACIMSIILLIPWNP
jgi:hypothetical protein